MVHAPLTVILSSPVVTRRRECSPNISFDDLSGMRGIVPKHDSVRKKSFTYNLDLDFSNCNKKYRLYVRFWSQRTTVDTVRRQQNDALNGPKTTARRCCYSLWCNRTSLPTTVLPSDILCVVRTAVNLQPGLKVTSSFMDLKIYMSVIFIDGMVFYLHSYSKHSLLRILRVETEQQVCSAVFLQCRGVIITVQEIDKTAMTVRCRCASRFIHAVFMQSRGVIITAQEKDTDAMTINCRCTS
ncbi:hypothetical protein J6590_085658 [Homalodisca vitripennis]|nr:hypothetical protein J6590_085658 [Homalodisca vitripennis]